MWNPPNYRLADAYINNVVDEKAGRRTINPFEQSYAFNGNGLRGNDIDFRRQMHEIMSQTDYGLKKSVPEETLTDKMDDKDAYIQDRLDEHKRDILVRQRESANDNRSRNDQQNINPYIPTLPIVQPYIVKHVTSPLESILTTTVLVIIGVLLCYLFIRALFPVDSPAVNEQPVGNMNLGEMVNQIEQNDEEN